MKKVILGLMLLAGSASFANNSSVKEVASSAKKVEATTEICSGYTSDGDRITLSCKTCTTKAECEAKLKTILAG